MSVRLKLLVLFLSGSLTILQLAKLSLRSAPFWMVVTSGVVVLLGITDALIVQHTSNSCQISGLMNLGFINDPG